MKKNRKPQIRKITLKIYLFHTQPTLSPTLSTMSARRGPPRYFTSDDLEITARETNGSYRSESESDGEEYLEEFLEVDTRVHARNDSTWMDGSVAGICTARGLNGTSIHSYDILFDNGKGLKRSIPRKYMIKLPEVKVPEVKVEIIDLTGETTVSVVSVTSQPSGKQSRIGQERASAAAVSVTPQNARNGKRKATTTSTTTASCTAGSSVSTSGPKDQSSQATYKR